MTHPPLTKFLCVEDEPDIQAIAKRTLETVGGFTIETSSSGKGALMKATAFAPDLILLDVMMPGMDDPETLHALRALPGFEATPVIFITAKAMASEIQKYKGLGALEVIPKPIDPMTLSDQIKAIWDARP